MAEEVQVKDIDIAMPKEMAITLGGQDITVASFKLGKSLRMMEYLGQLFEGGDLAAVFKAGTQGQEAVWTELSRRLPSLLRTARPLVLKVLALTLIPNKRLAEIDDNEESYEAEINHWVSVLKSEDGADIETAMNLMVLAIDGIGFDSIRKNFPKLLSRMGSK